MQQKVLPTMFDEVLKLGEIDLQGFTRNTFCDNPPKDMIDYAINESGIEMCATLAYFKDGSCEMLSRCEN